MDEQDEPIDDYEDEFFQEERCPECGTIMEDGVCFECDNPDDDESIFYDNEL